jgi:uncharacterized protein
MISVGNKLQRKDIEHCLDNELLQLIFLATENCNFRCSYCYEDYNIGKMESEVVNGVKILLKNRIPHLRDLHMSWFWGEPMAAFDVVEEICSSIQFMLKSYPHVNSSSLMTTNGFFLSKEKWSRLSELGVRNFQISLDGEGEIHNKTRRSAFGTPTFDRIWENLCALKDSSIDAYVILRIHFHPENILFLGSLIEKINSNFSHDSRFQVVFQCIRNLGGENWNLVKHLNPITEEKLLYFL